MKSKWLRKDLRCTLIDEMSPTRQLEDGPEFLATRRSAAATTVYVSIVKSCYIDSELYSLSMVPLR